MEALEWLYFFSSCRFVLSSAISLVERSDVKRAKRSKVHKTTSHFSHLSHSILIHTELVNSFFHGFFFSRHFCFAFSRCLQNRAIRDDNDTLIGQQTCVNKKHENSCQNKPRKWYNFYRLLAFMSRPFRKAFFQSLVTGANCKYNICHFSQHLIITITVLDLLQLHVIHLLFLINTTQANRIRIVKIASRIRLCIKVTSYYFKGGMTSSDYKVMNRLQAYIAH